MRINDPIHKLQQMEAMFGFILCYSTRKAWLSNILFVAYWDCRAIQICIFHKSISMCLVLVHVICITLKFLIIGRGRVYTNYLRAIIFFYLSSPTIQIYLFSHYTQYYWNVICLRPYFFQGHAKIHSARLDVLLIFTKIK